MNNKISNPILKQLISEIAKKANEGRLDVDWNAVKEADKQAEDPTDDLLGGDAEGGEQTPAEAPSGKQPQQAAGGEEAAPTDDASAEGGDELGADVGGEEAESPEETQADAAKKKAELEKAKADIKQAEDELEKQAYIKLDSKGGARYMIGKILGQAFKTNTIDSLAAEMAQKLKITTKQDAALFEKDMALYKNIPGMIDLISSIKGIAVEEPSSEAPQSEESPK